MTTSFEDRILSERSKLRGSVDVLTKRVLDNARGERSRAILEKTIAYESTGHLDFALFSCPPVLDHGKGALVYDVDGNEYIDLHAGFTVNVLGHGNTEVNDVMKAQMDKLNHFAELPMESRANLAQVLAEKHPGDFKKKMI